MEIRAFVKIGGEIIETLYSLPISEDHQEEIRGQWEEAQVSRGEEGLPSPEFILAMIMRPDGKREDFSDEFSMILNGGVTS